jgi:hypothetical protein
MDCIYAFHIILKENSNYLLKPYQLTFIRHTGFDLFEERI